MILYNIIITKVNLLGGGATDIRTSLSDLNSRLAVAGGGGGGGGQGGGGAAKCCGGGGGSSYCNGTSISNEQGVNYNNGFATIYTSISSPTSQPSRPSSKPTNPTSQPSSQPTIPTGQPTSQPSSTNPSKPNKQSKNNIADELNISMLFIMSVLGYMYYKRYCANSNIAIDQSPIMVVSTAPRQVSNPVAHRISITGQAIEVSNPMTNRITTSVPANTTVKLIKEV